MNENYETCKNCSKQRTPEEFANKHFCKKCMATYINDKKFISFYKFLTSKD